MAMSSVKILNDAGAVALFLKAELGMLKTSLTGPLKRVHTRQLKRGLKRSEPLLRAAADADLLKNAVIRKLAEKDRAARKALGMTPLAIASRAAKAEKRAQGVEKRARRSQQVQQRKIERLQAALVRARRLHAPQDQRLRELSFAQSSLGQSTVQQLIAQRDALQAQVAQGAMPASQAKQELTSLLSSGGGSAVAAQSQETAAEWKQASEASLDEAQKGGEEAAVETARDEEQAAAADVRDAARAQSSGAKALLPVGIIGAIGAAAGYAAAEKKADQTTYAAVGGVVGAILGLVVGKVLKRRAEAREAAALPAASAPAAAQPEAAVEGWY